MDIIENLDEFDEIIFKFMNNRVAFIDFFSVESNVTIRLQALLQKRLIFIGDVSTIRYNLDSIDKQLIAIAQSLFEEQGWVLDELSGDVIGAPNALGGISHNLPVLQFVATVKNEIALSRRKQTLQRKIKKKPRKK